MTQSGNIASTPLNLDPDYFGASASSIDGLPGSTWAVVNFHYSTMNPMQVV